MTQENEVEKVEQAPVVAETTEYIAYEAPVDPVAPYEVPVGPEEVPEESEVDANTQVQE